VGELFDEVGRGEVLKCDPKSTLPLAVMPRCARVDGSELLCSVALSAGMGINSFVPVLVRSKDNGKTWSPPRRVWPELEGKWSIHASISAGADGRLFLFGAKTPIEKSGESNWNDANQGLKANDLFWASSEDGGQRWSEPMLIPMKIAGSAEAPGTLCAMRDGTWVVPYAPYHTFDATLKVDRNQVVAMRSTDQGRSWDCHAMLRFEQTDSGGAEAWVVELTDGRLLGTSWHIDHTPAQQRFANAYAVSTDGGRSWKPTRSTGLHGNTTVLAPLNDGSALFGFVQRGDDLAAISIAKVRPTPDDFGIEAQQVVFRADQSTRSGKTAEDNQWKDFSFGEPSITVLDGGEVLVTYWCIDGDFAGIRSIRLRLVK
jgi:hypothetical protein